MKTLCGSAKSTNEQNKCFGGKKVSSALVFLEGAAEFLAAGFLLTTVTFQDACSSWNL